ncbi:MAG: hypothetical protein EHM70_15525, partial [Chloroflexota bacterium]
MGGILYDLGDLEGSFRYRTEGLAGLLAIGDVHSAAYILTYLADIHHTRLEEEQALAKLEQAGDTLRTVEDLRGLAAVGSLHTSCLLWGQKVQEARRVIERLLNETAGKATERFWGYRLNKLAIVQLVQAETSSAIATLRQAAALPATQANAMMRFEVHSTLALALTAVQDLAAAHQALLDAPRIEGLSRWAEFDRDLIEGYIRLACGNPETACSIANQVSQRAENYPLYAQVARQLLSAVQRGAPAQEFARSMWVGEPA